MTQAPSDFADNIPRDVIRQLAELQVDLPGEALKRLAAYLDLLLEVNRQFNLTAIKDRDQAWQRHIVDSLTLLGGLENLPSGATVIDVGSGGGLPGIPLAIARPDIQLTLLESTGKKATFLTRCAKEIPLPNVQVLNLRAETAGRDARYRERFDVGVCRAVGPLREVLEYVMPLVRVDGRMLAMKGARAEQELADAGDALDLLGAGDLQLIDAYPPDHAVQAAIVSIVKERPTPEIYPRLPGVARQSPL